MSSVTVWHRSSTVPGWWAELATTKLTWLTCACFAAAAAILLPAVLQIQEAEDRLEIGVHYQIPYPRMYHAPQFRKRQYMDVPIIK
jgi:hypothetical protein